ncbi:MAG TPA: hypothetical protein PLL75_05890 [Candidatus Omnitrophota bacterium]|nr:hypothetical protein [Candidatus Omnitrophota bacterium]HPS37239.1 hypothetical protein [Candidatus Omnitrophota bacterium]
MTGEKELGIQPLDGMMVRLGLSNNDLVKASTQQLSHKVVQKGRKGRRLTLNAQQKILTALKAVTPDERWTLKDLFNY